MTASRAVLARMDAAEIAAIVSSPRTTALTGKRTCGQYRPSTSTWCGSTASCSTARRIASRLALRMLCVSISCTEALAIAQAAARQRISIASSSRREGESFFESASPLIASSSRNTTQAANTGPASGPRPVSSTPQMSRPGIAAGFTRAPLPGRRRFRLAPAA